MQTNLDNIVNSINNRNISLNINGLYGSSKGLFLADFSKRSPDIPIIAIVQTDEDAKRLIDDCTFFMSTALRKRLTLFPSISTLPFSRISPEPEALADRINILNHIMNNRPLVVVAPVTAILRRLPPRDFISKGSRLLRIGGTIDLEETTKYLAEFGYEDVGLVEDEGSFARRGGILDIWPPTTNLPVRIELDGDRILSMHPFDPATQRSRHGKNEEQELLLIPVREIPLDMESRNLAAHRIRERASESLSAAERRSLIESIHEGITFSGIETLMPLFHEKTSSLFDFLFPNSHIIIFNEIDVESQAAKFAQSVIDLKNETRSPERIVEPSEIILSWDEFKSSVSGFHHTLTSALQVENAPSSNISLDIEGNADIRPMIVGHKENEDMLAPITRLIGEWQKDEWQILLTCHTPIQAERLGDLFHIHGIDLMPFDAAFDALKDMSSSIVKIRIGRLSSGFRWRSEKLAIITDEDIFGEKVTRRPVGSKPMEPFTSFSELTEGDHIVHEQHGIGRYRGLVHLTVNEIPGDYMLLEYLGGDKLYLPVYRLNLVGKYIGAGDSTPPLDKLGGLRWSALRQKVTREISLIAKDLLDTFARRKIHPGFAFPKGGPEYDEFCAAFPYDETPDQAQTIEDVMRDMGEARPADRLICGDVGYGKTEVAMRVAYRAAMSGKQVAVLVPTTVLALQHFETFSKRFGETPITIEMLSRFKGPKERKRIIDEMGRGTIDIVIGTHRLLQKDVEFRNLGLLIIDEEHRFGVRHKERIKNLKTTIDVLSLTATPIPRTLNMALVGIRDISVINTPPADRLSISTYVAPFDEGIIRQSILKEIGRGGQTFFVHNRVETIDSMHARLMKLVPEARIVVGHGQLKESELERVMIDFLERRADVLLCTTIIESGLDIPNANTIIIHRADTFGLAQLYQLRGRVGRSNVHAYAYLLTPEDREITPIAKKRLMILKRFTALGSGFQIAMHDLEFRGAGNILGSAQSGHINAIGYELYTKLLDRTIRKLKGSEIEEEIDPELNLKVAAFLPENYIADPATRIELYRRLASRQSVDEIAILGEELADRFGPLPQEASNLLKMMEIKIMAYRLKMRQITFNGEQFACQLDKSTPLKIDDLLGLVERESSRYRLVPPDRLLAIAQDVTDDAAILESAKNSLSHILCYVT